FPLLLVVLIGASFGGQGGAAQFGVVADTSDEGAGRLVAAVDDLEAFEVVEVADADELRDRVARGGPSAGLVVPDGVGDRLLAAERVEVAYVGRQDGSAVSLRAVVEGVISDQAAIADAAAAVASATGRPVEEAVAAAQHVAGVLPGVGVTATEVAVEGGLAQE